MAQGRVHLGPAECFLLGDNPPRAADSRYKGPVPAANIQGVIRWIWWPPARWKDLRESAR